MLRLYVMSEINYRMIWPRLVSLWGLCHSVKSCHIPAFSLTVPYAELRMVCCMYLSFERIQNQPVFSEFPHRCRFTVSGVRFGGLVCGGLPSIFATSSCDLHLLR